jgi:hypothetical protein
MTGPVWIGADHILSICKSYLWDGLEFAVVHEGLVELVELVKLLEREHLLLVEDLELLDDELRLRLRMEDKGLGSERLLLKNLSRHSHRACRC